MRHSNIDSKHEKEKLLLLHDKKKMDVKSNSFLLLNIVEQEKTKKLTKKIKNTVYNTIMTNT